MTEFGIDYASVDGNGAPDFKKAYAAGCRFAIVRGSWGSYQDPTVARDRKAMRRAGIAFGAYMFLRFPTKMRPVDPPEMQARAFIAAVGALEDGELPPSLDIEFPGELGRKATTLSARQAIEWCTRAFDTLLEVYHTVMVYTSERVWREDLVDLPSMQLGTFAPLWLKTAYYWKAGRPWDVTKYNRIDKLPVAWWGDSPGAWFHQIQGDALGVPGFNSTTDINLFRTLVPGDADKRRVRWIQNKLGGLKVDGDFGPKTKAALVRVQELLGLPTTGCVDLATFAALCS